MAATGKTPILLYGSTTATNTPVAGNLTNSSDGCEIAINVADKNLFFKDSTNTVNTVPIRQSSTSSNGWLSSTDWNTFNGKAPSFTYTSGYVPFGQGTTTPNQDAAFFWDNTNKRLGIGTNAPTVNLHTYKSVVGQNYNIVENPATSGTATNAGWQFNTYNGTSSTAQGYAFATANSWTYAGYGANAMCFVGAGTGGANLMATNAAGAVKIFTGGEAAANTRVTVASGGDVTVNTGNLVIGTSGKGIDFSATAGTGTSELLADYEEGTWTPTVGGSTTNPTVAYSTRSGTYTKVGRLVTATGIIVLSSTSGGSGNVRITGLPYTNGGQANVGYIGYASNYTTAKPSKLIVFGAESQVTPYYDSSATASAQLPVSFLTSTSAIYFTVQYETA